MELQVLAEDFKDNNYMNCNIDETGCPLMRALCRAGVPKDELEQKYHEIPGSISGDVYMMFCKPSTIVDFKFTI